MPKQPTKEDQHQHTPDEVVCFTSHGREICIHASQLEHIFKKGTDARGIHLDLNENYG